MSQFRKIVENILEKNGYNLNESIIKVYGKNDEIIRILKNPTLSDYKAFKSNSKWNSVRGIYGSDGNTYVWDADYGIHYQIANYLYSAGIRMDTLVEWQDFNDTLQFQGTSDAPRFTQLFTDRPEDFKIANAVGKAFTILSDEGKIVLNSEKEAEELYDWIYNSDAFDDNWELNLEGNIIIGRNDKIKS